MCGSNGSYVQNLVIVLGRGMTKASYLVSGGAAPQG